jgi:hypothetical protein
MSNNNSINTADLGRVAAYYTMTTASTVGGDIMRLIVPTVSTAGRVAVVSSVGLILSVGIGAWTYHRTGKHIFGYLNHICDDLIVVMVPMIGSINEREQARALPEHF